MNFKTARFVAATAIAYLALVGCGKSRWGDASDLEQQAAMGQIGGSPDYFLTKNGDDRVALIYGLTDDFAFCSDLADLYVAKFPSEHWSCIPASLTTNQR